MAKTAKKPAASGTQTKEKKLPTKKVKQRNQEYKDEQMEQMARQSLTLARARYGQDTASVARALSQLGMAQFRRANYTEAVGTHHQALAIRRKLLGGEDVEVAESLSSLALALQFSGKPTEAGVMDCLQRLGHQVETLAAFDNVTAIVEKLTVCKPDIVFNLTESFYHDRSHEPNIPALLEPVGEADKWQVEFPAALTKKPLPEWIFWESGVCEPLRVTFAGHDGSWATEYSPLSALSEIIAYAPR